VITDGNGVWMNSATFIEFIIKLSNITNIQQPQDFFSFFAEDVIDFMFHLYRVHLPSLGGLEC